MLLLEHYQKQLKKDLQSKPIQRVIIHTDRGTQFSSRAYNNFINHYDAFTLPRMSRENTPTDNAVAERFMRTFQEHQVNGKTFEQTIQESLILGSKSYRNITNLFIKSLNKRPNRKTLLKSPDRHDTDVLMASL